MQTFFLGLKATEKNTHTADQQASVWLLLCIMNVGVSGVSVYMDIYNTVLGGCGVMVCVLISNPFASIGDAVEPRAAE